MSEPSRSRTRGKPSTNEEAKVRMTGPVEQAKRLMADLAVRALWEGRRKDEKSKGS
jgi:hypothetical protein